MKKPPVLFTLLLCALGASAQIDTTSYAHERQELRNLMHHSKPNTDKSCNDFIGVGPKGDISYSHQQWQKVQATEKLVFKSVQVIPGNEFIRIYDGNTAVVNFLADVKLIVDGHDVALKVRRLEVYRKNAGSWCMIAGQGTQVDEKMFPVKTN